MYLSPNLYNFYADFDITNMMYYSYNFKHQIQTMIKVTNPKSVLSWILINLIHIHMIPKYIFLLTTYTTLSITLSQILNFST